MGERVSVGLQLLSVCGSFVQENQAIRERKSKGGEPKATLLLALLALAFSLSLTTVSVVSEAHYPPHGRKRLAPLRPPLYA